MPPRKPPKPPAKVDAITHADAGRPNLPTAELASVAPIGALDDDVRVAYERRNRDLDPQLVWRGKDAQDETDLIAPAPPIYIEEKIHPKALIADLMRFSLDKRGEAGEPIQADLFADFNGLPEGADKTAFYQHDARWSNRMILGDSLQAMASLSEREGLRGNVQCIYIDPPYGIRFNSNFQWSTTSRDVRDGDRKAITREPEQVKAFRDTWRDGVHSYLTYLRDRLTAARDILSDSGSIFVQIGDENVHRVRALMDEVFGEDNLVAMISFRKKLMPLGAKTLEGMCDYLVWYAKKKDEVKYRQLYLLTAPDPTGRWTGVLDSTGLFRRFVSGERQNFNLIPDDSKIFGTVSQWAPSFSQASVYDFEFQHKTYAPARGQCWITTKENMQTLARANRLFVEGDSPRYVNYHDDFPYRKLTHPWHDTAPAQDRKYVVETNDSVVARCILMTTDPGDLVLDPTCGSGTTAYIAEQWGRRWITIDTSRVALALARMRIMGARYPYYILRDSPEGQRKEAELRGFLDSRLRGNDENPDDRPSDGAARDDEASQDSPDRVGENSPDRHSRVGGNPVGAQAPSDGAASHDRPDRVGENSQDRHSRVGGNPVGAIAPPPPTYNNVRQGFVYQRVPHVTLRDIANNGEIDVIWEERQAVLEPLRAELNAALGQSWEEWEIPAEADAGWPEAARTAHAAWREGRAARQREIDASIARNAAQEYLYDKPYTDGKRVRVAGPFTVESLSPHRSPVASEDVNGHALRETGPGYRYQGQAPGRWDFAQIIMDDLKIAGVQQARKEDAIRFTSLVGWPGKGYVCAEGRFTEGEEERRCGIFIGPEFGTVSRADLTAAAREAAETGFDLLISCAFSYDGHTVGMDRLGRVRILRARMNADLHMSTALKATDKGNLFVVFGEPDVRVEKVDAPGAGREGASGDGDGRAGATGAGGDAAEAAGAGAHGGGRAGDAGDGADAPGAGRAGDAGAGRASAAGDGGDGADGEEMFRVRVLGVDVYRPSTGRVESSERDEIACWFVDTDYNEESFFVRQAYFLGANADPYKALRTSLRAEINEEAWASLRSDESRPFPRPQSGRIAVKVINHLGDEVMKVVSFAREGEDGE